MPWRQLVTGTLSVLFAAAAALWVAGLHSSAAAAAFGYLVGPAMLAAVPALVWSLRRRARHLAVASAALLLLAIPFIAVRSAGSARPAEVPSGGPTLDIVTFNVLFRGGAPDSTLALLRATPADLFLLQEVTPGWARALPAALGRTHPHQAARVQAGTHGLAIFSRLELSRARVLEGGRGRPLAQCAIVRPADATIAVCNLHLASPAFVVERAREILSGFDENARVRQRQWRSIASFLRREYGDVRHVIVAGDFNTLETEPLYADIRRGLVDAFGWAGTGSGATFPSLVRIPPFPLVRIDYVMTTPSLRPIAARVLPPGGSDHLAVHARIAVPPPDGRVAAASSALVH